MTYIPQPIDTTNMRLPEAFLPLAEILAQNTHDLWALKPLSEGWTYGPQRDDVRKQPPI